MGYEVVYHYYKSLEKGEYDKEDPQQKSVKVGTPYEDVSLEALAGKIMSFLARRDIFVFDVGVFEFAKKEISYRQTSDGIIIKNKKFKYNDEEVVIDNKSECEDSILQKITELLKTNPELLSKLTNSPPQGNSVGEPSPDDSETKSKTSPSPVHNPLNDLTPIRREVYNPDETFAEDVKSRGMKFTIGKNYPIYEEKPHDAAGRIYKVRDDEGKIRMLPQMFFSHEGRGLGAAYEKEVEKAKSGMPSTNSNGLKWDGVQKEQPLNIR